MRPGRIRTATTSSRWTRSCARLLKCVPGAGVLHLTVVGDGGALLNVIGEIQLKHLLPGKGLDEGGEIAREEQARVQWHGGRQVERSQDGDTVRGHRLSRTGELAVPPAIR